MWTGDSRANAQWLEQHAYGLCDEFTLRFNKEHACFQQLLVVSDQLWRIPDTPMTDVALCVGEELQRGRTHAPIGDAVEVYREFYRIDKAEFAKWEKGTDAPEWW